MSSFRSIALAAGGVAVLAVAAAFTVSLTIVAGTVVAMSLLARSLMPRRQDAKVYARAKAAGQDKMRVWNDGRGTIIDL